MSCLEALILRNLTYFVLAENTCPACTAGIQEMVESITMRPHVLFKMSQSHTEHL